MADAPPSQEPSDAELMRRTAGGDREAFASLYRRHQGTIFRFARLMTGCTTAAEDVVQEVFLALMRNATRYEPGRSALSTYLYGIARRHTRRRLLRDQRFTAFDDVAERPEPASEIAPDSELSRRDELDLLRGAILTLPSRYREVIVLCDLQDVNYSEAALMLSCPVGTIRSRLHRGRQMLAVKLGRSAETVTSGAIRTRAAHMRCAT
jgi:RNA polymerase sigma-70 factor, ECF subfamily